MTAEDKAALAEGGFQGRAVRSCLETVEAHRLKRGRKMYFQEKAPVPQPQRSKL